MPSESQQQPINEEIYCPQDIPMVQFETTQSQSLGRPQEVVSCEWSRPRILSTGLKLEPLYIPS